MARHELSNIQAQEQEQEQGLLSPRTSEDIELLESEHLTDDESFTLDKYDNIFHRKTSLIGEIGFAWRNAVFLAATNTLQRTIPLSSMPVVAPLGKLELEAASLGGG